MMAVLFSPSLWAPCPKQHVTALRRWSPMDRFCENSKNLSGSLQRGLQAQHLSGRCCCCCYCWWFQASFGKCHQKFHPHNSQHSTTTASVIGFCWENLGQHLNLTQRSRCRPAMFRSCLFWTMHWFFQPIFTSWIVNLQVWAWLGGRWNMADWKSRTVIDFGAVVWWQHQIVAGLGSNRRAMLLWFYEWFQKRATDETRVFSENLLLIHIWIGNFVM